MKSWLLALVILCFVNSALADQAIIRSIDDVEYPQNYIDVSEEGLPQDHYLQLIQLIPNFRFTSVPETKIRDLFEELKRNPKARMRSPGGLCSRRRIYIQGLLKKISIVSGRIFINCPANNGRLRLKDQVSGRNYIYSNFHDANIVTVMTNAGNEFRVLDPQFQDTPTSLHDYLTLIEGSQKIRPLKRRGSGSRLCYWSISTPSLTY